MLKTVQDHPNYLAQRLIDRQSSVLAENSKKFVVTSIDQNRLVDVRYHAKSCYTEYKRKGERHEVETTKRKPQEPDL